MVAIGFFVANK